MASSPAPAEPTLPETWAVHGQITNVTQWHGRFNSPYRGTNSLQSDGRTEETTDITVYAGLRLWKGAELWLNPEVDQGFGLDNTVGMAGFPSGEAYKVGADRPYLRLPRLFVRQTMALGSTIDAVLPAANQLAGSRATDNLTITVGKFSPTDVFDTNDYAHDPRADLMNWSIIDAGAFDYAADAWGYTYGAAAEWTQDAWTARGGVFQLSDVPNGKITRVHFGQFMLVGEFEQRYAWAGQTGKVKLLGFLNHGRMASYRDATAWGLAQGSTPDLAPVRRSSSRAGIALNLEHPFTPELGGFARASFNDGSKEAYEFTEINRSVSGGLSLKGTAWRRADDTLALAFAINGLSRAAREYFAAGGIGILIGDGGLDYGYEKIVELSYSARLAAHLTLSLDYQHVNDPAYNRDRGPVSIYGLRAHADF
ncbi:MAG: carbohydrate porin [Pseudomonadota bacterium]|nr:carbohydrate porin [Pseudomonadota bacterium]